MLVLCCGEDMHSKHSQALDNAGALSQAFLSASPLAAGQLSTHDSTPENASHLVVRTLKAHLQAGDAAPQAFCSWLLAVLTHAAPVAVERCLAAGLAEALLDRLGALSHVRSLTCALSTCALSHMCSLAHMFVLYMCSRIFFHGPACPLHRVLVLAHPSCAFRVRTAAVLSQNSRGALSPVPCVKLERAALHPASALLAP